MVSLDIVGNSNYTLKMADTDDYLRISNDKRFTAVNCKAKEEQLASVCPNWTRESPHVSILQTAKL